MNIKTRYHLWKWKRSAKRWFKTYGHLHAGIVRQIDEGNNEH